MKFTLLLLIISYPSFSDFDKCLNSESTKHKHRLELLSSRTYTNFYDSPAGNFRIHYDTIGVHAPDLTDSNNNKIPDYIDSVAFYAEDVRNFYIERGWNDVPTDSIDGNPPGGSAHYDIYIDSIDSYGAAKIIDPIEGADGLQYTSEMYIRHNYNNPALFETTGFDGLKITIAHEYHHAIQYTYQSYRRYGLLALEMTSTYFEGVYLEGNNDIFRYLRADLFREPYLYSFAMEGGDAIYSFGLFWRYLTQKYGEDIVQEFWELENVSGHLNSFDFLLKQNYNFDLKSAWEEFILWCLSTGHRANENYGFHNADIYPELQYRKLDTLIENEKQEVFRVPTLSFSYSRIMTNGTNNSLPDTLDFIVADLSTESASVNQIFDKSYRISHRDRQENEFELIDGSIYQKFETSDGLSVLNVFRPGGKTQVVESSFPNPFNPNLHNEIFFGVDERAVIFAQARVQIFDANMVEISSNFSRVESFENKKVVKLKRNELPNNPGVYFFRTSYRENYQFGKFVILEK